MAGNGASQRQVDGDWALVSESSLPFLIGEIMETTTTFAPSFKSAAANGVVENDTFSASNVTVRDESGAVLSATKRTAGVLIEELIAEKDAWFNNAYRTSNEQLYALLAKCYGLYQQLSDDGNNAKLLREGLNEYIESKGYTFSASSHTIVKIVKCVFGADRRRVSAYGIVLRTALSQKLAVEQIPDFIRSNGGVEEIRLAKSPNAMTPKSKAEMGKQSLRQQRLGVVTSPVLSAALDAGNIDQPVVLLGTWQSDGSVVVHTFTNSGTAVTAALASHYASEKAGAEAKKQEQQAANDGNAKQAAIDAAAQQAVGEQEKVAA
jgi:hypothetical protein